MNRLSAIAQLFISVAHAHGSHSDEPAHFVTKWAWDPSLIFFLALSIFYFRGLTAYFRGSRHAPVARWQVVLFFCGIAVLALAALPPIDTLADQLFSVHMAQHLLITSVGVPLVIFGAPSIVAVRGFPRWFRKRVFIPLMQNQFVRGSLRALARPLNAVALYELTFWLWHVPYFYDRALLDDRIHLLEHACMAAAAMNLWRVFIDPKPLRSDIAHPVRLMLIGSLMIFDTALSAALTFSRRVWYAYAELPLPDWWSWDRLQDQRVGGLIMWVPGGAVWLIALLLVFAAWVREERGADAVLAY